MANLSELQVEAGTNALHKERGFTKEYAKQLTITVLNAIDNSKTLEHQETIAAFLKGQQ